MWLTDILSISHLLPYYTQIPVKTDKDKILRRFYFWRVNVGYVGQYVGLAVFNCTPCTRRCSGTAGDTPGAAHSCTPAWGRPGTCSWELPGIAANVESLTMNSVLCFLFSILSTLYSVLCTQYSVLCTLYSVLSTRYSVLSTQFSVLSTRYLVKSTKY